MRGDVANRCQFSTVVQPIDDRGAAPGRFRNAEYGFTILIGAGIGMVEAVVQRDGWGRQPAAMLADRNDAADPAGQRHFLTQDLVGAGPRKWVGEIAIGGLRTKPSDVAKPLASKDLLDRGGGRADAPPFRHQSVVPFPQQGIKPSQAATNRCGGRHGRRTPRAVHRGVAHEAHRQSIHGCAERGERTACAQRAFIQNFGHR